MRSYIVIQRYPASLIKELIGDNIVLNGHNISLCDVRMKNLIRSCRCVVCERSADYFNLEYHGKFGEYSKPHLNAYTSHGHMLTMDHIVPKSSNGPTTLDNAQTMCERCNKLKKSRIISPKELLKEITISKRKKKAKASEGKRTLALLGAGSIPSDIRHVYKTAAALLLYGRQMPPDKMAKLIETFRNQCVSPTGDVITERD